MQKNTCEPCPGEDSCDTKGEVKALRYIASWAVLLFAILALLVGMLIVTEFRVRDHSHDFPYSREEQQKIYKRLDKLDDMEEDVKEIRSFVDERR